MISFVLNTSALSVHRDRSVALRPIKVSLSMSLWLKEEIVSVSLMNVIARVLFLVVRETCWLPGCSTAKPERCWASIFADLSLCAMDGPLKSYYESLTGPCFSSTE